MFLRQKQTWIRVLPQVNVFTKPTFLHVLLCDYQVMCVERNVRLSKEVITMLGMIAVDKAVYV